MSPWKTRSYQALGFLFVCAVWALVAVVTRASLVATVMISGVVIFGFFAVVILLARFITRGGRRHRDEAVHREAREAALHALPSPSRGVRLVGLAFCIVVALAALILRRWEALAIFVVGVGLFAFQLRHDLLSRRT